MLNSLVQAFKVPELRNKILFTLGILALYRLGAYIPVPGIPFHAFADAFSEQGGFAGQFLRRAAGQCA